MYLGPGRAPGLMHSHIFELATSLNNNTQPATTVLRRTHNPNQVAALKIDMSHVTPSIMVLLQILTLKYHEFRLWGLKTQKLYF